MNTITIILTVALFCSVLGAPGFQGEQCKRGTLCKFGHYCCSQVVWWWQHCCPNGVVCCQRFGPGCGKECDDQVEEDYLPKHQTKAADPEELISHG
uniref:Cysteine rich secreted protein n=1 Tax=Riptortus pedestris TaxID=329032 RepID=R4WCJ1_RIPPE|nr:cysteine rich secreted protein [Riptortus pedestris]